jgi:hypothetical protein
MTEKMSKKKASEEVREEFINSFPKGDDEHLSDPVEVGELTRLLSIQNIPITILNTVIDHRCDITLMGGYKGFLLLRSW